MAIVPVRILNEPGIRRDGTRLEGKEWGDGQWVRFQRGRPRKIRGVQSVNKGLTAVSRQLSDSQTQGATSYIHSGHQTGIDAFTVTSSGVTAIQNRTPAGFVYNANNSWQFATIYDPVSGLQQLVAVANTSLLDPTDAGTAGVYSGPIYTNAALTAMPLLPFNLAFVAAITAITQAASAVVTVNTVSVANPFNVGQVVSFTGVVGMTQINNLTGTITAKGGVSGAWTITVNINSSAFSAYTSGGTVGVSITGVSGGVCILNPYTILYGSNGYFAWSDPNSPLNFITVQAGQTNITWQKILRGLPLRGGGGYSPAGLFWSVDALIRATFVGGTQIWQFDTLSAQSSLMSANAVVEVDGSFYWPGNDGRFYRYNGVVQELPNTVNLNWFYDGLNTANSGKVFAFRNPRWGEIWWCYPREDNTECSDAIIYNYRENSWYDTELLGRGRSAAVSGYSGLPIACEPGDNSTGSTTAITAITNASPMVITAPAHGLSAGAMISVYNVGGMTQVNGQTYTVGVAGVNTLTITGVDSTTYGVYTSGGTVRQALFTIWQHEVGTDTVDGSSTLAIPAFVETTPITKLEGQQPDGHSISAQWFEPDFIQVQNMTLTIYGQTTAKAPDVQSQPYTIYAVPSTSAQQIVPCKEERRQMRVRFSTNVIGGDFQLGDTYMHAAPGSKKMTT